MKLKLEKEAIEYMKKKEISTILLEYMPPCSLCNGSVGHIVAHLVTVRDRNKIKDKFTSFFVEDREVLVPNEMMEKSSIEIQFKKSLFSKNGTLSVMFKD